MRSDAKPWSNRYCRSTDVNMEWVVVSEPAEAPFESRSGKAVFAEGTAKQLPVTIGALETPFGTFGLLGAGGMGKKGKDIGV